MRKLVLAVLVLALSPSLFAANWYVSKAVAVSGTGADWTNAWKDFGNINFTSVACGDTIWIAAGSYTGTINHTKTTCAANPIVMMSVLSTDSVPTGAAGYSSTFAYPNQVLISNGGLNMNGSGLTIDCRTGNAATSVAYGCQWSYTGNSVTAFSNVNSGNSINGYIFRHLEIKGPSCVTAGSCTGSTWGINLNQTVNQNITIDHVWLHSFGELIRPFQTTNLTVQFSYIGEDVYCQPKATCAADHEDLLYASDPLSNLVFNGNVWYASGNDGIFFDNAGCSTCVFTNNIFIGVSTVAITMAKTGTSGPYIIVNNTFVFDSLGSDGATNENNYSGIGTSGGAQTSASLWENNILYNTTNQGSSSATVDYNAWTVAQNSTSFSPCGIHCFSYANASPVQSPTYWVNFIHSGTPYWSAILQSDMHLSAGGITLFQGKGLNLTAQCSTYPTICADKDGNARPTSGAWDLGAFNANASPPAVTPSPAVGLFARKD